MVEKLKKRKSASEDNITKERIKYARTILEEDNENILNANRVKNKHCNINLQKRDKKIAENYRGVNLLSNTSMTKNLQHKLMEYINLKGKWNGFTNRRSCKLRPARDWEIFKL
jgi:hypothetical protein